MSERDDELEEFGIADAERVDEKPASSAPSVDVFDGGLLRGKRSTFAQALAARTARRSPILQSVARLKRRTWVVGFGPETIPARSTRVLTQRVRCLFQPQKIISVGDTDGLTLESFFIGQKSQMELPTSMAVFGSPGVVVTTDLAHPATDITLRVSNRADQDRTVALSMMGEVVQ